MKDVGVVDGIRDAIVGEVTMVLELAISDRKYV